MCFPFGFQSRIELEKAHLEFEKALNASRKSSFKNFVKGFKKAVQQIATGTLSLGTGVHCDSSQSVLFARPAHFACNYLTIKISLSSGFGSTNRGSGLLQAWGAS